MPLAPGQVALTSCRLGVGRLDAFRLDAILAPPDVPSSPYPAHGAIKGPYALAWAETAGASDYDVYFGTSSTPPLVSAHQAETTYNLAPLTHGTVYYWRILARNAFGSTLGPVWSFTASFPEYPTTPDPPTGTTDIPNELTLSWTGPPFEPGLTYKVYFGPDGAAPPLVAHNPNPYWTPPAPLANATRYVWRVESVNNAGVNSSPPWEFGTWGLGAPAYLTPANGATNVPLHPIFTWTAGLHATSYRVYLGIFNPPPTLVATVTGTTWAPPMDLGADTLYYWRVESVNSGGTTMGATWTFRTTDPTKAFVTIDGVAVSPRVAGFVIHDYLNDTPNTLLFTIDGTAPHVGSVIAVGLGSSSTADLIFAGTIDAVEQVYEAAPANRAWRVSCIDWWRRLNRYDVLKAYAEQSATAIVLDLIATYAPGFTTANVAAGLPTVTGGIQFTHEPLGTCLKRVMQIVGGYWYVDYGQDVHAFLTDTTAAPDPIVPASTLLLHPPISQHTDMSQTRTRVLVVGASSQTITDVAAGESTIPIEDASFFRPDGTGVAIVGTIRIPHTGVYVGGSGSTVQGAAGPTSSAPTVALAAGTVGGIVGAVDYRVSFKNTQGETVPGLASNSVIGAAVSPPAGAPSPTVAAGIGRIVASNLSYVTTYQTAHGETLTSSASSLISPAAVSPPGAPAVNLASGIGYLIGAYNYRVTFVTQYGETTGGSIAVRTASALTAPAAPTVGSTPDNGPLLGTYRYAVAYVTADGRETLGTQTGTVAITATTAQAPAIAGDGTTNSIDMRVAWLSPWGESVWSPVSTDTNHGAPPIVTPTGMPSDATGWVVFSSGSYTGSSPGVLYRMADVYTGSGARDFNLVTGLKATSAAGTMGKKAALTITTGPAGTVARRIYRTKAGGTDLFLAATIPNNTATTHTDVVPDSALTTAAPTQNLNGDQHALTGIPTGLAGTLARRIYRTVGGGAEYRKLVELADNTTTTFTDNVRDADLGADLLPVVNTAGGQNVTLTVSTGPPGTLARKVYRTKSGGGSQYFFMGELKDNTSTALTDDRLDAELGEGPPLVNTAGASSVQLSSIPTGPASITARRVYRLDPAGLYRFVVELKDNTTTSYLDVLAAVDLGDVAPTVSTIGAVPGATSITVASATPFRSAGGWVTSGSQVIRYTGISGTTLTGIPASGPGSLISALQAGDEVIAASLLTGTTLPVALARGDAPTVLETVNDTAAQAAMITLEGGGDGVYEYTITDSRLGYKEANAAGTADLRRFSRPIETIRYACRDRKTRSGVTVHIDLPSQSISGDYVIQSVTIDQVGVSKGLVPRFTVEASSVRWSFEDVLRQILIAPS